MSERVLHNVRISAEEVARQLSEEIWEEARDDLGYYLEDIDVYVDGFDEVEGEVVFQITGLEPEEES